MSSFLGDLLKVVVPRAGPASNDAPPSSPFEVKNPLSNGIMHWTKAHIFSQEEQVPSPDPLTGRCRLCMNGENTSYVHKVIHPLSKETADFAAFLSVVTALGFEVPYRGWKAAHQYFNGQTWEEQAQGMQQVTKEMQKATEELQIVVEERGGISKEIQAFQPRFVEANNKFQGAFGKRVEAITIYQPHIQKALKEETEFLQTLEKTCIVVETIRLEFISYTDHERQQLQLILTIKLELEWLEPAGKKLLEEVQSFEHEITLLIQENSAAEEESIQSMRQISAGIEKLRTQLTYFVPKTRVQQGC